jgi:hypothetical protein
MKAKMIMLLTITALMFSSCKKDEDGVITREDYYGTYIKSSTCVGEYPGTSSGTITVSAGAGANEITIHNYTNNNETFPATINGASITLTTDDGYDGTGSLSGDVLTIEVDYGNTVCTSICTKQ